MIRKIGQAFVLDTAHTTYAFSILPGGHPEHLYYGRTIHIEHPDDLEILVEKHVFAPGNVNICEKEHAGFSLEDVRLEMSSYGKGDIREPFVEAILYDGAKTLDFRFEDAVSYAISKSTKSCLIYLFIGIQYCNTCIFYTK